MRSICLHVGKHRVEGNAFPGCSEFRPSRDAVHINRDGFGRQLAKRLPIPFPKNILTVVDHKFPAVERYVWGRPRGQDGEVSSKVLSWRKLGICRAVPAGKAS